MPRGEGAGLSPRPYRIFETRQFLNDVANLGASARRRLEIKLREHVYPALQQEPHFGPNLKRLSNWEPPTWRYRVGEWRFFYEIDEAGRIVFMTAAEHRKQAYR
jgi:mRNA interferase RelE/StbE